MFSANLPFSFLSFSEQALRRCACSTAPATFPKPGTPLCVVHEAEVKGREAHPGLTRAKFEILCRTNFSSLCRAIGAIFVFRNFAAAIRPFIFKRVSYAISPFFMSHHPT